MSVFGGLRLCFFLFKEIKQSEIKDSNYKHIMLLLRFLTVELYKKKIVKSIPTKQKQQKIVKKEVTI